MQGYRLPDRQWPETLPEGFDFESPARGAFWKVTGGPYGEVGAWHICTPDGSLGAIPHHVVEEHDDGLISVVPIPNEANSILVTTRRDGQDVELYHGFIHHGWGIHLGGPMCYSYGTKQSGRHRANGPPHDTRKVGPDAS